MATATKSRLAEVQENLNPSTASYKAGVYTVRWGFFYTNGMTTERRVAQVRAAFPEDALIVDSGEIWKPFRGGASVANQSHWYVKFTLGTKE